MCHASCETSRLEIQVILDPESVESIHWLTTSHWSLEVPSHAKGLWWSHPTGGFSFVVAFQRFSGDSRPRLHWRLRGYTTCLENVFDLRSIEPLEELFGAKGITPKTPMVCRHFCPMLCPMIRLYILVVHLSGHDINQRIFMRLWGSKPGTPAEHSNY